MDDVGVVQLRVEHHLLLDLVLQARVAHQQLVDHLDRHALAFFIITTAIASYLIVLITRPPSLGQVNVRRRAFAEELEQRVLLISNSTVRSQYKIHTHRRSTQTAS